jgi:catechol 2,3-dioxygenase-like lactoylglutathione lyase family enzyme
MANKIRYVCPLIVVSEMERSRHFYETILDQKVIADFGENITFQGDFALHLKSHFSTLINKKDIKTGGNDFELYFEFDEIEQINTRLKMAGTTFVHEMCEQPWHQKVLRIYDPDNHIIEIGESMEYLSYRLSKKGKSPEEISKMTLMPVEFVCEGISKFSDQKSQ